MRYDGKNHFEASVNKQRLLFAVDVARPHKGRLPSRRVMSGYKCFEANILGMFLRTITITMITQNQRVEVGGDSGVQRVIKVSGESVSSAGGKSYVQGGTGGPKSGWD